MAMKISAIAGSLSRSQRVTAVEPTPSESAIALDHRAAEDEAEGEQRGEHQHRQGDRELLRALLPDRALVAAP